MRQLNGIAPDANEVPRSGSPVGHSLDAAAQPEGRELELDSLPKLPRNLSVADARAFDGSDRDDEGTVMPGDKCRLGAGCVNGARPVLRGFGRTIGQGSNIGTPQRRNPWKQGKTKCILNPKGTLLLARSDRP